MVCDVWAVERRSKRFLKTVFRCSPLDAVQPRKTLILQGITHILQNFVIALGQPNTNKIYIQDCEDFLEWHFIRRPRAECERKAEGELHVCVNAVFTLSILTMLSLTSSPVASVRANRIAATKQRTNPMDEILMNFRIYNNKK